MQELEQALLTALSAIPSVAVLAPGGVWNTARPQDSQWPVIVFNALPSVDSPTFSADGFETLTYDVQAIAPADARGATLGQLANLIHAALQRQPLTITGYRHMQTLRSGRIPSFPEVVDGVTYRRAGGTYRIWVSPA